MTFFPESNSIAKKKETLGVTEEMAYNSSGLVLLYVIGHTRVFSGKEI